MAHMQNTQEGIQVQVPTLPPNSVPISSATRCATVTAATRRGCVQATAPPLASPASYRYRGI